MKRNGNRMDLTIASREYGGHTHSAGIPFPLFPLLQKLPTIPVQKFQSFMSVAY